MRIHVTSARLLACTAITLLCVACGDHVAAEAGPTTAGAPTTLPLKEGFYVASDTACSAASSATLLLFQGDGFNGARDGCRFKAIEPTGPGRFRVTEQCVDFQAGPDGASLQQVDYQLTGDTRFTSKSDRDWTASYRHCEQTTLPAPWRDADLGD